MTSTAEQRVFISYRRSDCQSQANGLHDGLRHRLTDARIFMDIDSIPPGADFEEHIRNEIEQCSVVLVLIGDEWLEPRPGSDVRRIDEANDFVRLEVESSLGAEHVRVIPVLVEGARMPAPEELPDSIRRLARLNAFELSDSRWSSDIERLTEQLRKLGAPPFPRELESAPTMTFGDVDDDAIRYAVGQLPRTFTTKDLSEHPAVLATHTEVANLRNYHTIVGRYLMKHRHRLGLGEPERPTDDRGSIWTKTPAPGEVQVSLSAPPITADRGRQTVAPAQSAAASRWARFRRSQWFMAAVPLISCGLAAWVPPLWAASKRKFDRAFQQRMYAATAAISLAVIAAFVLLALAPEDATGTATGPLSDIGATLMLLAMAAGAIIGFVYRNPAEQLPGADQELARRAERERYRRLVATDRQLAASMRVGRPDLARDYHDGGLVDINSLSAHNLSRFVGMPSEEARHLVEVRGQLGRFSDLNEVLAYADLSEPTVARLRDLAVFL